MDTLRCFGRTVIEGESDRARRLRSRKHLALLVYLTAHRGRAYPRERIASLFWDTEPRLARHSLSQALYDITQKVAGARLNRSATEVGMAEGGLVYEADEFESAIRENELARAVDLYGGSFVPDLETAGSHDFERWVEDERHRLRRIAEMALFRYVRECDDDAQWGEMCLAAHRLLKMNPLNEEAHRALMRGLWLKGDQAAAVSHFEEYAPGLERELPGGLSEETLQLVARIRSSRPRATGMAVREIPRPEMVGRKEEFEALKDALRGVHQGTARLVRVHGEAGMGKTRLLEEFRDVATLEEVTVLQSRCYAAESEVPYSPVIDALRPIARSRAGRSGDAETFYQLGHLFPRLFERPDEKEEAFGEPEAGRRRLFEEVAALLRGVLADRPLVWLVEDFHWIDASSAALIHYLVRRLEGHPLLVILTVREHEGVVEAARDFIESGDLTRVGPVDLTLSALGEGDTRKLLTSLGDTVSTGSDTAARIHSLAGGNPFFALELLRAADTGSPSRDNGGPSQSADLITRDLRTVLSRRLRGLSPKALRILESVAVAGRHATPRVVAEVAGLELPDLAEEAADLYRRQLLRDAAGRLEFLHDITREFVYTNMGALPQAAMHLAVAERLAETRDDVGAATLARHFERGGDQSRAFEYALRAAKEAEARHAHEEAIRMAEKARECSGSRAKDPEVDLVKARAELATGKFVAAEDTVAAQISGANPSDSMSVREARVVQARAQLELGNWDAATANLREVLESPTNIEPKSQAEASIAGEALYQIVKAEVKGNRPAKARAALYKYRDRVSGRERHLTPAVRIAESAYSLFCESAESSLDRLAGVNSSLGDIPYDRYVRLLLLKGMAATRTMNWQAAEVAYRRGLCTAEDRSDLFHTAAFLANLGVVFLEQGKWADADTFIEDTLHLTSTFGGAHTLQVPVILNAADSRLFQGQVRAAIDTLETALTHQAQVDTSVAAMAQVHASLGLALAQQGSIEDALSHYEQIADIDVGSLSRQSAIQNRYKIVWLRAYAQQVQGADSDQVSDTFANGLAQEQQLDPASALKLEWLAFLFENGRTEVQMPLISSDIACQLKESGMGWFIYASRRWHRRALS
jgi:DNA-binding SARP family transcriptional activator